MKVVDARTRHHLYPDEHCTTALTRISQEGVLHAWKSNLRNKRFRRARDTRAILWVPVLACASMAARAASPAHSPHCGECAGHLFASQLQRTAENRYPQVCARAGLQRCPPAHNMGELSRRARTPARLRIRSVHVTEVFCQPRSAHIARTPINLFNCHRRQ